MANIKFVEAPASADKGFRMGRPESLFKDNVTFTVTGVKFGNYTIDGAETKYADVAQAILFTTSIGEDLNINRLLKGRKVVYLEDGTAKIVDSCTFKADFLKHMETLGRREDNTDLLKGTVEVVGNHAKKFFDGKTIKVSEAIYFAKDDKNRLVPGSPTVQFSLV